MRNDLYVRSMLTVIAAALVYLCLVFTPWPAASAQRGNVVGAKTPGESTGPAEVVIVDWRLPDGAAMPVNVLRGDVRIVGEVDVNGRVEVQQEARNPLRVVAVGYEDQATTTNQGRFTALGQTVGRGMPVVVVQTRP